MKSSEYETELKALYAIALKQNDVSMALELLERCRKMGFDDVQKEVKND